MPLNRTLQFKDDTTNRDLLNAIRNRASSDYQSRIPEATKANIRDTLAALLDWQPAWNEFISALVNRIGMEIYRHNSWTNPLGRFKIGNLSYGDTIEEVAVGLLKAKIYDSSREALEKEIFGTNRPEVQTNFHTVNRREYYTITINEPLLQQAFLTEYGLAGFISQLMATPETSDNYDEYLLTTGLFKLYHDNGGFFNVNVPDLSLSSTAGPEEAREALKKMRAMAGILPFPSRHYNASGLPMHARQEDLHLFITPEANATMDVEALAGAFNITKADMPGRTTLIPPEHFRMPGTQAIMTTSDFFVIADQRLETRSAENPVALQTNYFLHHWQVISASRFVPAIRFSTDPSTEIVTDEIVISGVTSVAAVNHDMDDTETVTRGNTYGVDAIVNYTPEFAEAGEVNFTVMGSGENPVPVSPRTYINPLGPTLWVGPDEANEELTITAVSAYDPGVAPATGAVQVVGDILRLWPNPDVVDGPTPPPFDPQMMSTMIADMVRDVVREEISAEERSDKGVAESDDKGARTASKKTASGK